MKTGREREREREKRRRRRRCAGTIEKLGSER